MITKRNKSNEGNSLHFSSVCSFRFTQEGEDTILIKYRFTDEVMEVHVKKRYRQSQQNPLDKKYSGSLLVNAEKLKDILDLLPYIPAVNHLFNENLRADSEANKHLILRSLIIKLLNFLKTQY
jgi:hypothetical protein